MRQTAAIFPSDDFEHRFRDLGYAPLGAVVDAEACRAILAEAAATRTFDETLFLSETEFDADPQHRGVNPRPGRNLADRFQDRLAFIERNSAVTGALTAALGEDYVVLDRKFVCGFPEHDLPGWVRERLLGNAVNNLGAYVRPEFRDVTYFYGIDYHQDIIDWPDRAADFVTLYVYLDEVGERDAPLHLLEGSHRFGATKLPHDLACTDKAARLWRYGDGAGRSMTAQEVKLTGPAGFVGLWHPFTLHGTQPSAGDRVRLSLRYLVAQSPGAHGLVNLVNAEVDGAARLNQTRNDLAGDGAPAARANAINTTRKT